MAKKQRKKSVSKATPLDVYKSFIDALVEIRPDVCSRWVQEKRPWPDFPENHETNNFISTLTDDQRKVLADLLQDARDGGIHDTLAYLNDEINLKRLRLLWNAVELPIDPFGSELYFDWTCRVEGDSWPDSNSKDEA